MQLYSRSAGAVGPLKADWDWISSKVALHTAGRAYRPAVVGGLCSSPDGFSGCLEDPQDMGGQLPPDKEIQEEKRKHKSMMLPCDTSAWLTTTISSILFTLASPMTRDMRTEGEITGAS